MTQRTLLVSSDTRVLRINATNTPSKFGGSITLPPSKSYLHRALFVSALINGESRIEGSGRRLSDDIVASIGFLRTLGTRIRRVGPNSFVIHGGKLAVSKAKSHVFVGGSGTTARLGISLAALAQDSDVTTIVGDETLSKRPMQPLLDALAQLGISCKSVNKNGMLPVAIRGGGIRGGTCAIDGSVSSQFISSLLISCIKATKDTTIKIMNPAASVSEPYIAATLSVLRDFGFYIRPSYLPKGTGERKYKEFKIRANQTGKSKLFHVPGDMSSGAALIGAALSANGSAELRGVNFRLPQPDCNIVQLAMEFGARVVTRRGAARLFVEAGQARNKKRKVLLDLKDSPDIVPTIVGMAVGMNAHVKITNIGHLRFKESDRISTLVQGFRLLGARILEGEDAIENLEIPEEDIRKRNLRTIGAERKTLVLDPKNDHRMLMAFTIAGLSGRFGNFSILNPDCVSKSYPEFLSDIQSLCHQTGRTRNPLLQITRA